MSAINQVGISPRDALDYTGAKFSFLPCFQAPRRPLTTDYRPQFSIWRVGKNASSQALLNGVLGEFWYLSYYNSAGEAIWLMLTSGSAGTVVSTTGDDGIVVFPNASGNINFFGLVVPNSTYPGPVRVTGTTNTEDINVQVSAAIPSSLITKVGLAAFNDAEFTVDANGFVSLIGSVSPAIQGIVVDAHTSPGTSPVLPNASGNIIVTGGQVAAGTTANVILTNSLADNTYTIQVQRSQAVATSTVGDNGVSHYNSSQFSVDGNGFVSALPQVNQSVENLGINLTGTTFTITSANGTALSSTNPGYVHLQSMANPGQIKTYVITANQSFTQAGLGNNLFGLTTGVGGNPMPFYIYAVSNANAGENTVTFMISRIPNAFSSPVAGKIAQSGNTNATTQGSFFSFNAITASDYASSPCLCIGAFRQTYASSLWFAVPLMYYDGIGQFLDSIAFSFSTGQFGTTFGSFFQPNGGTAPVASGGAGYIYFLDRSGLMTLFIAEPAMAGAGVGSVGLTFGLPLQAQNGGNGFQGYFALGGSFTSSALLVANVGIAPNSNASAIIVSVASGGSVILQNTNISINTQISLNGVYVVSLS